MTVTTSDVAATLRSLLHDERDLDELDVSPPTLEDVYLELVAQ